jgi:hypothetical protein
MYICPSLDPPTTTEPGIRSQRISADTQQHRHSTLVLIPERNRAFPRPESLPQGVTSKLLREKPPQKMCRIDQSQSPQMS